MAITVDKDGKETGGIIDDDVIQPFSLETTGLRGRMVRLGSSLKQIIEQHDYPLPVSYLVSEAVTLSLLLSAMLKYDGIFTLQIQADGAIRGIVVDVNAKGHIRAYAGFDKDAIKQLAGKADRNYYDLLQNGHMAFTVDQGENMDRYQGIVQLEGESLLDAVQHYFEQSEQIKTAVRMAVHPQDDQWRAGAVMVQYMPESMQQELDTERGEERREDWRRTKILLESCKDDELLSPNLHSADVLYRLFHEEGVRIYPATAVKHVCRCSRDRVANVLMSLSGEDRKDAADSEGKIDITCEFCGKTYLFTQEDLKQLS
ncbi:MAG: molecular chaperone [Micavibrio sp.]|nr:MAG: molecular chaperone [Micavibrio sp.]